MTGPWNDFNSAQSNTNVIPKGTIAKVRLTLRPGGFDDASFILRPPSRSRILQGNFAVQT